jgi:rRNA pseudouridine-1189 N-methylase Emg1 (Nep1/Mra1 family)
VAENRRSVGVSEILSKLTQNPVAELYAEKTGTGIDPQEITEGLKQESLGVVVGKLPDGEELFAPVPLAEFKSRCRRRSSAVEGAHARR